MAPSVPETPSTAHCLVSLPYLRTSLAVLNGKWKLQILVALTVGQHRFGDLRNSIAGISAKVLAKELKDLEMHRLIQRTVHPGPPVAVSYEALPYSQSLDAVIFALRDWGIQHEQLLAAATPAKKAPRGSRSKS